MSIDLTTRYLGLGLKNPLVVAACPLTKRLDSLRRLEDAGASAVVLPSLFEEQVAHEILTFHRRNSFGMGGIPEAMTYSPEMDQYNTGHDSYLELIAGAKKSLSIPVIASLNGTSKGGWVCCGEMIEQTGADALELNIYHVETNPDETSLQVETRLIELVTAVREVVQIPIAVKMGTYFSSIPNMAKRLAGAGANGLVLFNRFLQPGLSLETLELMPHMTLTRPEEIGYALRWIGILRPQLKISLAATGGVHEGADVLKLLLVGANAVMTASALLLHGPGHLTKMLDEVRSWMDQKGISSISGLKLKADPEGPTDLALLERIQYLKTIVSTVAKYD
jgi:dihydroorotate dehydrogenase (fumarate)